MQSLSTYLKIESNHYNRIMIGLIAGIFLFFIWPFIQYYISIHHLSDNEKYIYLTVITLVALSFSFIATRIPQKEVTSLVIGFCFIAALILSSHYNNQLKNWIAVQTHFFSDPAPFQSSNTDKLIGKDSYPHYNYEITLNKQWIRQTDKGPMFAYYHYIKGKNKLIELRPQCLQSNNIAMTDIINNINASLNSDKKTLEKSCYTISKNEVACSLSELDSNGTIERIRWQALNTEKNYGIALDFVLLEKQNKVPDEIISVITSAKNNNTQFEPLNCINLSEWM